MKKIAKKWSAAIVALVMCLLSIFLAAGFFTPKKAKVAEAASSTYPYTIDRYDVEATITEDRKIVVVEELSITVYRVGAQKVFYKSLPLEGDRYQDLWAEGVGNPAFSYEVADNPDVQGFIDINCTGGVEVGAQLTYRFGYTLLVTGEDEKNGMIIDFVGAGTPVPIQNVTVDITFPAPFDGEPTIYSDDFGGSGNRYVDVVEVGEKTLHLEADLLPLTYSERFSEYCAAAITVSFRLVEGGMQSYASSLWSSKGLLVTLGFSMAAVGVGLLCFFFVRKKKEIVTVVNLTAPDQMDPLQMGALLDGKVDNEDVTSMIYYFAEKGYLKISLEDESNPTLIKLKEMDKEAPAHQKVLFDGLFSGGGTTDIDSLKYQYYESVDKAKMLVATKTSISQRYEKKTVTAAVACLILAVVVALAAPFFMGKILLHESYLYFSMPMMIGTVMPVLAVWFFLFGAKEVRFKGKGGVSKWLKVGAFFVAALGVLISVLLTSHVLSQLEQAILSLACLACVVLGIACLTISEKHAETLGHILGFKEFIVVTEEDKIKCMLEEDPQTYYHILPYAQVLGVTNEWEEKFKGLTLEPPTWCTGYSHMTFFDYYLLSRAFRLMSVSMLARPQQSTMIGRSGGGGGFGGFSGGGHGGGGFGMR